MRWSLSPFQFCLTVRVQGRTAFRAMTRKCGDESPAALLYSPGQGEEGTAFHALLVNSLLEPGFLFFCGSHNVRCAHLQGVYRLGQACPACTVGNGEVMASYFHFINRKQLERKAEPGLPLPVASAEMEKPSSFLTMGGVI